MIFATHGRGRRPTTTQAIGGMNTTDIGFVQQTLWQKWYTPQTFNINTSVNKDFK